ncbi:MAG: 3-keto-disaccharide hydrolase [Blastocatellia bacterium]
MKIIARLLIMTTCLLATGVVSQSLEPGFQSLFNGRDLSGWDGDPKFWSVKGGAITGVTRPEDQKKGAMTYLIWKGGDVGDFELRLDYRTQGERVNSGISYRGKRLDHWMVAGYQADLETGNQWNGVLVEMEGRLHLAMRGQKTVIDPAGKIQVAGSLGDADELQALIKKDDWNKYVVIARGNHLIHKINGRAMIEARDEQVEKRALSGVLALQLHHSYPQTVQFKNIGIQRLSRKGK